MPSVLSTFFAHPWLHIRIYLIRGFAGLLKFAGKFTDPRYTLKARIPTSPPLTCIYYHPASYTSSQRYPIYLNLHGGGFSAGHPENDAEFCAFLARKANCVVISAEYGLAPERPYPAALNDIQAIIGWIRQEHAPSKIAVGGFSAGGTLALGAVQQAPASSVSPIVSVVAFFPVMDFSTQSKTLLKKRDVFLKAYLINTPNDDEVLANPILSPVYAPASALPDSIVMIAAEQDPNHIDIQRFVDRMVVEKGVRMVGRFYEGTFHGWTHVNERVMGKERAAKKWEAFEVAAGEVKRIFWGDE
ncbi:hypothetical protein HK104_004820 [Borealophlyctis nickersoniae]|nr:hypothetical protein HK104_004820 [Borealophlyctis nickersoniae]